MKKVYYFLLFFLFALYLLQYTIAASAPQKWRTNFPWSTFKSPRELSAMRQMPALVAHQKNKSALRVAQAYLEDWQSSVVALLATPLQDTIFFTVDTTPASCHGAADGGLTVTAISGGKGPYQVSLDGGQTYGPDTTFHQLAAGRYLIMVKDAAGEVSKMVGSAVGLEQEISFQVRFKNAGCEAGAGGEIVFDNPTGGTAPYVYSIDGGQRFFPAPEFFHLAPGQYLVQVKDARGCSSQPQRLSLQQLNPVLAVSSTGATSSGTHTGTITAQANSPLATGGDMMALAWAGPERFQTYAKSFRPLANISELRFNQSAATVGVAGQPLAYTIEVYNAGGVWKEVYGGVWEEVYGSGVWEEVYTHTDVGRLSLSNLAVSFPAKPAVSGVRLQSEAAGGDLFRNFVGTVLTLTGSRNDPEIYSYSIDGGATYQSSGYFTGLPAGTYTVLARNSKGCISEHQQVAIAEAPALGFSVSQQNPSCAAPESGSITIQASGGTVISPAGSPFSYDLLWPGPDSFNHIVIPFPATLTNLSRISFSQPGYPARAQVAPADDQLLNYRLDLYNPAKGVWQNVYTAQTLTEDAFPDNSISFSPLTEADQIRFSASDPVNQVFSGFDNLQIRLEGTTYEGGTFYQYSIDGGATFQAGNIFTGLKVGTYLVMVKDALGAVKTDMVSLTMATSCPDLSFAVQTLAASCDGTADGSIILASLAGGRRPYQFSPDGGKTYQPDSSFNQLAPGSYPVVMRDAFGRLSPAQAVTIPVQKAISFQLAFENPGCDGPPDGKITIGNPAGGTAPYTYSIDGGATFATGNEFPGLAAGVYQVQVKDVAGCRSKSEAVSLEELKIVLSVNPVPASCAGSNTGSIWMMATTQPLSGGQTGHLAWFTPADFQTGSRSFDPVHHATSLRFHPSDARVGTPGAWLSYNIEVYNPQSSVWENVYSYSDVGVLSLSDLEVFFPEKAAVSGIRLSSTSPQENIFQGFGNAAITIKGRRDVPEAYTYSIDAGETFQNTGFFPDLAAGTYTVLARHNSNCSSESQQVTIQQPPALVLNIEKQNASCLDPASGAITIKATGGTTVPPQSKSYYHNLIWPGPDTFEAIVVPLSTTLNNVGQISFAQVVPFNYANVQSPGGEPLTYHIDLYHPGKGVWENVYSARTDGQDFFSGTRISFPPTQASQIRFAATANGNPVFSGFNQLQLLFEGILLEGGVAYQYSIDGGRTYQTANAFTGLEAGTYPIMVKDATGCVVTDTVRIELPRTEVQLDPMPAVCLGQAPFGLTGGSPAGGFFKGKGVLNNTFDPLLAGVGNHQITYVYQDGAGCMDSASTILAVQPLPATILPQDSLILVSGSSRHLGTTPVPGYTYHWQPAAGLSDSTQANPVLSWTNASLQPLSLQYQVTITDPGGCALTDTLQVQVLPGMRAYAGSDTAVCVGNPVGLGAPARPGFTYHWSPATGLSDTAVADPQAQPHQTTTYVLTLTERATGLQHQDSVTITIKPAPALSLAPDGAPVLCAGGSLILRTSQGHGYTYQWFKDGRYLPDSSRAQLTVASAGEYYVVAHSPEAECPAASARVTVVQEELPVPVITANGSALLCLGGAITLSGPTGPGYQYQWYRNHEPVLGARKAQLITSAPGSYQLQVTSATGCAAWSEPVPLTMLSQHDFTQGPYCMGFENHDGFAGWHILDQNADSLTWAITDSAGRNGSSGLQLVAAAVATDDWVFTRCLELEGGKDYTLAFYYALGQPEKGGTIKVGLGNAQTTTALSTVWDLGYLTGPAATAGFARAENTFHIPKTGVYYLAFQSSGPAGSSDLYVDDICLRETPVEVYNEVKNRCLQTDKVVSTGSGTWQELKLDGKIVGAVNDYGTALGEVFAEFFINADTLRTDTAGTEYHDRNWIFRSEHAFAGKPVGVRLYGMNQEVARYQAANDGDQSDISSITDLGITRFTGPADDCRLENNTGEVRATFHRGIKYSVFENYFIAETTVHNHFSEFYLSGGPKQVVFEEVRNNCIASDTVFSRGLDVWQDIMLDGHIIGAIKDNGRILGKVYVELYLNQEEVRADGLGIKYLDRNWHIITQYPFTGSTVSLRLYGTMAEFEKYRLAASGTPAEVNTVEEIGFTKYSGPNEDCLLENNDFGQANQVLFLKGSLYQKDADYFAVQLDVQDHFSELYGNGGNVALPVELLSFSARQEEEGVRLTWRTATEKNNARFYIEASDNDIRGFYRIGEVKGQGNSFSPTDYRYLDAKLANVATRYYRLKQVDLDGSAVYSKILAVKYKFPGPTVGVQPTLFSESFHIVANSRDKTDARLDLYATSGALLLSQDFQVNPGLNKVEIRPSTSLPVGLYLLHIRVGHDRYQKKIIKVSP